MRIMYFLLLASIGFQAPAQEFGYWDREDFEIGNKGVQNDWKSLSFRWQEPLQFNISDGSFMHLRNDVQKDQIDMLAVIDKSNRNRITREIDLGSPIPQRTREKKVFEVTGSVKARDQTDSFMNPFNQPFQQPLYRHRGFGVRAYQSPFRYQY